MHAYGCFVFSHQVCVSQPASCSSTQRCVHVCVQVDMALTQLPAPPGKSNVTKQQFLDAVLAAKEYILVRP